MYSPSGVKPSTRFSELIPNRPRIAREFVERHQRLRLLRAAAKVASEHGGFGITTARLIADAHMARSTFYELFPAKSAFLEFAFAESFDYVFDPVRAATATTEPWLGRLDDALEAFFGGVSDDPSLAALCLVHSQELPAARGHDYQAGVNIITAALAGGREAGRGACGSDYRDPPPDVEEFLAQAIVSFAAVRLRQGDAALLRDRWREMAVLASTPFLGPNAGSRFAAATHGGPGQPG